MSLQFIGDRWHLDGRGIHAGDVLEIRQQGHNRWLRLRAESRNNGRVLDGYLYVNDGPPFVREIGIGSDVLRWPKAED